MNHKVRDVQELYETARTLYENVVMSGEISADSILTKLEQATQNLKDNWKGVDAGINIEEVIKVHNEMITVRNALAVLAHDSSVVASNYREIQNANGAGRDPLPPVIVSDKNKLEDYTDTADTIDINPEAEIGRQLIDSANGAIDGFIDTVNRMYEDIMNNWQIGTGRNSADGAFQEFLANAKKYKETLSNVSQTIAKSLQNYSF